MSEIKKWSSLIISITLFRDFIPPLHHMYIFSSSIRSTEPIIFYAEKNKHENGFMLIKQWQFHYFNITFLNIKEKTNMHLSCSIWFQLDLLRPVCKEWFAIGEPFNHFQNLLTVLIGIDTL